MFSLKYAYNAYTVLIGKPESKVSHRMDLKRLKGFEKTILSFHTHLFIAIFRLRFYPLKLIRGFILLFL